MPAARQPKKEIEWAYLLYHTDDEKVLQSMLTLLLAQGYTFSCRELKKVSEIREIWPNFCNWKWLFLNPADRDINPYGNDPYAGNKPPEDVRIITDEEIIKGLWAVKAPKEVVVELTPKHKLLVRRDGIYFRSRRLDIKEFVSRLNRAYKRVNMNYQD